MATGALFETPTERRDLPGSIRISNYPLSNSVHEIFVTLSDISTLLNPFLRFIQSQLRK